MLAYICGRCENHDDPVIPDSGLSVLCNAADTAQTEVHLHHQCAGDWSQRFKVSLPHAATAALDKSNLKHIVRILIADDFPTILQLVKEILDAYPGFEVVGEARDGLQAVALAEALKPDVVVLNVTMPTMSGFEAARRIRLRLPDCAIVILSSHKDEQFIAEARMAGAQAYIEKSDADRQLVHAIESAVKGEDFFVVE